MLKEDWNLFDLSRLNVNWDEYESVLGASFNE